MDLVDVEPVGPVLLGDEQLAEVGEAQRVAGLVGEDQNTPDPSDDVDTDINHDGKLDTALAEIYYNPTFYWTNRGAPIGIDFYSVLTLSLIHI